MPKKRPKIPIKLWPQTWYTGGPVRRNRRKEEENQRLKAGNFCFFQGPVVSNQYTKKGQSKKNNKISF